MSAETIARKAFESMGEIDLRRDAIFSPGELLVGYDIERRTKLARRLKAARQRSGLSAKEAAEKLTTLGVTCSRGTLLAWERGGGRTSREPFASDLRVLASAYDCSVNDFFDDSSDTAPAAPDFAQPRPPAAPGPLGTNDRASYWPAMC